MNIFVSGDVLCATIGPVAPAGQYDGQDYYEWTNDNGTWFLWAKENPKTGFIANWEITGQLGVETTNRWVGQTDQQEIPGQYGEVPGAIPIVYAIVAEYVPATVSYVILQVASGPDTGKLIALRAS